MSTNDTPRKCHRSDCIALAVPGSPYCAVHRWFDRVDATLGSEPQPEMVRRLERDEHGSPSALTPKTVKS
jgi:hypothetical protein